MTHKVGDRVSFNTDFAHLFDDSPWGEKLSKPRNGTIVKLHMANSHEGKETLLVEWDSLTGAKMNPEDWRLWVHSNWLSEALALSEEGFLIPKARANGKSTAKNALIVREYCEWIGEDPPCVKCWAVAVDLIHIRDHCEGYIKPEPQHTLPMCRLCHTMQETDREFFAPLTVEQAREAAAHLFHAYEVMQDHAAWSARLSTLHDRINVGVFDSCAVIGAGFMGEYHG